MRDLKPCCLDPGFGRPLQEARRDKIVPKQESCSGAQALRGLEAEGTSSFESEFFKICTTASHFAKLGVFSLECAHRFHQTLTNSSKHLGRAKNFPSLAAESVLHAAHLLHRQRMTEFWAQIRRTPPWSLCA